MKTLVDIINFNSDASCLSSANWLNSLKGGKESKFLRWLKIYSQNGKKVTLGLTGATIADLARLNPESIDHINGHPDIYELILRPFSHDIALLRTPEGFRLNFSLGEQVIKNNFKKITNYYLPPEFMLTNEQLVLLHNEGVKATFVNSARFPTEVQDRLPDLPYTIEGLQGATLGCIPVQGKLTQLYLYSLQNYSSQKWNQYLTAAKRPSAFFWRDGESPFLIPDGLTREETWIKMENKKIQRKHLSDLDIKFSGPAGRSASQYNSYPVHSFSAWMEGSRMLGFIHRVQRIEDDLKKLTPHQIILWLHIIGSDILSAVEKKSPCIKLKYKRSLSKRIDCVIQRSERGFEGEEFLYLLENSLNSNQPSPFIDESQKPHIVKLRNKITCLTPLLNRSPEPK